LNEKLDLILHPVRMKIVQALVGTSRTTHQLQDLLPDVPQATLYRQLQKLVKAGILEISERKQVRGTIEKTYTLSKNNQELTPEELQRMDGEEHMRYFMMFLANLVDEFGLYTRQTSFDLHQDGAGYRQAILHLNPPELAELASALRSALLPFVQHGPSPDRRRYSLATILIPEPKERSKP
jgi:DNA-binding HxlR family transcriptional regulator